MAALDPSSCVFYHFARKLDDSERQYIPGLMGINSIRQTRFAINSASLINAIFASLLATVQEIKPTGKLQVARTLAAENLGVRARARAKARARARARAG